MNLRCFQEAFLFYQTTMILINHLIFFILQTGDYGVEANDDFFKGKGIVFRFVITVLYGIPIGLLIIKFNLHTNQFVVGYSIVIYYFILLFFEFRILYNTFLNTKKNRN